jgi:hypothetical protein
MCNPVPNAASACARSAERGGAARPRARTRQPGVVVADRVLVHPETHVQQGGTGRVLVARELDGAPGEFGRAGRGAGLAGEFGRPGAEPGQVETGQGGRVGDIRPQREGPFEMAGGLGQAEHGLGLACRLDRGGQRLGGAARLRPVRRELGRRGGRGTRQFPGEAGVQLLALAGEDRRVDGFGQQRVAEPEGARGLVGDEDLVLDGLAQRRPHVGFGDRGEGAAQRGADVASGGGRRPQQVLAAGSSRSTRWSNRSRRRCGSPAVAFPPAARFLGEEGVASGPGDDGVRASSGVSAASGAGGEQRRRVLGRERADRGGPGTRAPARRRRPAGPCAPSTKAPPGGRWRAVPPVVRPGCWRGTRPGRALTYRPSAGPRARAAPARRPRDR